VQIVNIEIVEKEVSEIRSSPNSILRSLNVVNEFSVKGE